MCIMTHDSPVTSTIRGRAGTAELGTGATIDDREQELRLTAERFASSMGEQFDMQFDFTVESLSRLDGWLTQWVDLTNAYGADRPEDISSVALAVAAYVGEVIRVNQDGASWVTVQEEDQLAPPHIRLANGVRVNLMKKAVQSLTGADTPNFATLYQTVTELPADASELEQGFNSGQHE